MSPAKKKTPAADMAPPPPRPPGPGVEDPSLDEPTAPVAPPPPKASQQGPATVTPTGAPTGAPPEAMAQQGEYLTTAQGARLRTTDHALKAGRRGPVLLQDHHLREKNTHFDHERIPERVVHARGTAAVVGKLAALLAEHRVWHRFGPVAEDADDSPRQGATWSATTPRVGSSTSPSAG